MQIAHTSSKSPQTNFVAQLTSPRFQWLLFRPVSTSYEKDTYFKSQKIRFKSYHQLNNILIRQTTSKSHETIFCKIVDSRTSPQDLVSSDSDIVCDLYDFLKLVDTNIHKYIYNIHIHSHMTGGPPFTVLPRKRPHSSSQRVQNAAPEQPITAVAQRSRPLHLRRPLAQSGTTTSTTLAPSTSAPTVDRSGHRHMPENPQIRPFFPR